jgi:hypothetical protein
MGQSWVGKTTEYDAPWLWLLTSQANDDAAHPITSRCCRQTWISLLSDHDFGGWVYIHRALPWVFILGFGNVEGAKM